MKIIKLKATTNGCRHQVNIKKSLLSKSNKFVKSSIKGIRFSFGRSKTTGHITSWHKGGGVKNLYRKINFENKNYNSILLLTSYDPCRSAFTSLSFDFERKVFNRFLYLDTLFPGSLICCKDSLREFELGYRSKIKCIPTGSIISNLSINKKSTQYIRSAGALGQIIQKDFHFAKVRLPSNKIILVSINSYATIGAVGNTQHNLISLGKAGKNRLLGRRPIVRGIAMNPVDHPHGGRTNGGKVSTTPWGLPTKGKFKLKKKKKNYE